ncbi:ferric reductase-like transmembrane domain-containing protein [Rhizomonospora bruguierae]|uniref:ferric reductase-like transmembrane domain-containing protein n=1 Tax=Rhizomonospora bruguierae TaxID=1581705 RepID=UPI001BD1587C|nr:hypothetical protein [Micromonospora sp. NBRC 107566]
MAGVRLNQRGADPTALTPAGGGGRAWLPVVVLTGSVLAAIWAVAMLTPPGRVGVAWVSYFLQFYAGVFTLVSLSITVMAGLLATDRLVLMVRHRVLLQSVHRTLGTMAVVFLVVHIFTKVLYNAVSILGVIVPFTGGNRPVYVGLGILAGYLMGAVFWTGIARARFIGVGKPWMWRSLHATVYLSWPLALVHGLSAGRPAATWVIASYLACVLAVTILLVVRVSTYLQRRRRGQLGATTGTMKPVGRTGASPTGTGSGFRYVAESDIRAAYAPKEPRQPARQPTAYEQRAASYEQMGGRIAREYQTEEEYAATGSARGERRPVDEPVARERGIRSYEDTFGGGYEASARPVSSRPVSGSSSRPVSGPVTRPVSGGGRRGAPEAPYREDAYGEDEYVGRRAAGRRSRRDEDGYQPARYREDRAEFPASAPPRQRFEDGYAGSDHSMTSYTTGGYSTADYVRAADPMPTSPPPTGTPWRESSSDFAPAREQEPPGPPARSRAARHSRDGEGAPDSYRASAPVSSAYPPASYPHESQYPRYGADQVEPDETPTLVDMASRRAMRAAREAAVPAPRPPRKRGGAPRQAPAPARNLTDASDEEYWAHLRGEAR